MSYDARVLADSISPDGVRLTTLIVTFPRFILAEVNTHRMLSRNSASSRAIPTEKQIERVIQDPFVPETFNARVKGMGVGDVLDDQRECRNIWMRAAGRSVSAAVALNEIGVDKSRVNRLLEPFLWHTAIISATEWDNFFALRDHPAAQPEFQIVARLMRVALEESEPRQLPYGAWHLPLVDMTTDIARDDIDDETGEPDWERLKLVSAGRCARVSYDTHENYETQEQSIERSQRLMGNGHFSPFEHVATPMMPGSVESGVFKVDWNPAETFRGNFRGWVQFRKEIPGEDNFGLVGE